MVLDISIFSIIMRRKTALYLYYICSRVVLFKNIIVFIRTLYRTVRRVQYQAFQYSTSYIYCQLILKTLQHLANNSASSFLEQYQTCSRGAVYFQIAYLKYVLCMLCMQFMRVVRLITNGYCLQKLATQFHARVGPEQVLYYCKIWRLSSS